MRLSWFGEFLGALPEALQALYLFGDPNGRGQGWWGLLILLIWGLGLVALPLWVAKRTYKEREWVSATMGVVAGLAVLWWIFGILPSAWIYFVDGSQEILEGTVIPASMGITGPISVFGYTLVPEGYRIAIADDLYVVVRDLVVVVEHLVAFVLVFWAMGRIQDQYPRTLAPGETRSASGGYK